MRWNRLRPRKAPAATIASYSPTVIRYRGDGIQAGVVGGRGVVGVIVDMGSFLPFRSRAMAMPGIPGGTVDVDIDRIVARSPGLATGLMDCERID